VILAPVRTDTGGDLYRISAAGGDAKPLRPLAQGETAQMWPQFFPDGKHYLYLSIGNAPNQQGIYAASLDSNDRTFIVATNTKAAYVQSGQLLFTRGNVLMAQPFDPESLKLSGEPRPVADHIEQSGTSGPVSLSSASFSASPNGVLMWRQATSSPQSSLQWFDRSGRKLSGAKHSYIATLVERHSRFAMLVKVPGKDTEAVVQALSRQVRKLPATLRRSLTWDRGLEMARHKEFTVATKVKVYFCDPQSPWQRGTNENTNLLLRQYFPRGTDLAPISQAQLDQVALRLNQRPRKTLGFQTPAARLQASVASTV
jgi:hypothetical protein